MRRIILLLTIMAIVASLLLFWKFYQVEEKLKVNFLDVGQGDAIFIQTPFGQNILIDGGPDNTILKKLRQNLPWWDRTIDLMILTHPHNDHVSGLINVIQHYKVKKILYTGVIHTAPNYLEWLELIKNKKILLSIINKKQIINLGNNSYLNILYPTENFLGKTVDNLNNSSIVIQLVYKKIKFLFPGDAEIELEKKLLNNNINLSADILKIGHQGSDNSSSGEFLQAVNPQIAVIQVGKNNFGHPSRRVLKKLERLGIKIYRTDLDKTIKIISDGEKYWVMNN